MSKSSDNKIIKKAMSILGSKTSKAKRESSRENGKKGGRPAKVFLAKS